MNHIHLHSEDVVGRSCFKKEHDLLHAVFVRLGDILDTDTAHKLHRLLSALFLTGLTAGEKGRILEEEYGIRMEGNRKEMLESMCNLGQGIEERALEKGLEWGIEILILDNLEEGRDKETILQKVQKRFQVTKDQAEKCFQRAAATLK